MQYRTNIKNGDRISALGFGAMRMPVHKDGKIDKAAAAKMIDYCIENGVNYFDTAYTYHREKSEPFIGRALKGRRKDIFLATKLPHMRVKERKHADMIFENQLARLQTDYIDYYLFHNVMSFSVWERLKSLGIIDFIEQRKRNGQIHNIGFSAHMSTCDFIQVIDDYDWDFVQIQYNYLDENTQVGKEGLAYAKQKGLPVIVMEPVRGGLLASPNDEIKSIMDEADKKMSPAAWALKWVWNHDGILTVLSGMSNMDQLVENIETAKTAQPESMSKNELRTVRRIRGTYEKNIKVPCTRCEYCVPCPHGVRIPAILESYNRYYMFGPHNARFWYMITTSGAYTAPGRASQCVACGACVSKCPQGIPIIEALQKAKNLLETEDFDDWAQRIQKANRRIT